MGAHKFQHDCNSKNEIFAAKKRTNVYFGRSAQRNQRARLFRHLLLLSLGAFCFLFSLFEKAKWELINSSTIVILSTKFLQLKSVRMCTIFLQQSRCSVEHWKLERAIYSSVVQNSCGRTPVWQRLHWPYRGRRPSTSIVGVDDDRMVHPCSES